MSNEAKEPPVQMAAPNKSKNMGETTTKEASINQGATRPAIQLPIHFIKSEYFRVVHASGVWFGGDAQQNLHLSFFNERTPIPQEIVLNLNEQGIPLGEDASKRKIREGFVREVEVDIIFSLPAAVDFYRALGENLKALKAI